jgi:hypothetical protein
MNQAYAVLAHNLANEDCEWTVCTGPRALEQAQRQLAKWLDRDGKWVGTVRPVGEPLP